MISGGGATHVAVATDHVIESFRNGLWPGYKTGEGIDPDLLAQFPLLEDALSAAGVVVWPMVEFEADDALAAAAVAAARDARVERVIICTPDKDLAQCVRGTRIVQLNRRTRVTRDEAGVVQKFGVPPESIPDYLALVGDAADGYPGLPGWGAKSSAAVLARFGHLESIPADWREWRVNAAKRERPRADARRASATARCSFERSPRSGPTSRCSTTWTNCDGRAPRLPSLRSRRDWTRRSPSPAAFRPVRFRAERSRLDGAVPPRERHRLSGRVFIDHIQPHGCAPLTPPCAALGRERCRMFPDERFLLLGCQLDHSMLVIGMKRREDLAVEAKVGMPHVRTLDRILHPQRDSAEVVGSQHDFVARRVSRAIARATAAADSRRKRA